MASGGPALSPSAKAAINLPQQSPFVSQSQAQLAILGSERQRRHGGGASGGSSTQSRAIPFPRSNQHLRKQHRTRKPPFEDEDSMAEANAIRSSSSRKGQTSITHLMKFALPPRLTSYHQPSHHRRTHRQAPFYWHVEKSRHIHANYRFVISPKSNPYSGNVDERIEWDDILQVLASAHHQTTSCPICLSIPVASRMAKCGHIFCLPCLIRYLHSSNDSHLIHEKRGRWNKCPICWDAVYLQETRPVRWLQGQAEIPQDGADVVLRLMMRKPNRILALPRDSADVTEEDVPWCHAAEVLDYARVMRGSEAYMLSSFDEEIEEVLVREREDELLFGESTHWTQKAIAAIEESKGKTRGIGKAPEFVTKVRSKGLPVRPAASGRGNSRTDADNLKDSDSQKLQEAYWQTTLGVSGSSAKHTGAGPQGVQVNSHQTDTPEHIHHPTGQLTTTSHMPFFFYQLLPHYYLAPLDIRILKAAFGDYCSFPTTILPRVERVSIGHVVDDEIRRRAKYLAHLPQGCEINFLECDLTDIVPPAILRTFADDIERRRKGNQEKQIREEKERLKAEREEEEKRLASIRRKRNSLTRESGGGPPNSEHLSSALLDFGPSPDSYGEDMLSQPQLPLRNDSAFATLASPSTSPDTPRTVWGTPAFAPVSPVVQAKNDHLVESKPEDGWLQGWEQSLTDSTFREDSNEVPAFGKDNASTREKIPNGGAKKRKGKRITLMTTNARRAA